MKKILQKLLYKSNTDYCQSAEDMQYALEEMNELIKKYFPVLEEDDDPINDSEIIITTKEIIRDSVKQEIRHLYNDVSDFSNNRYMNSKEFEQISEQQQEDIINNIINLLNKKI